MFVARVEATAAPGLFGNRAVPLLAPPTAKPTHRPKVTPTPTPAPTAAPTPTPRATARPTATPAATRTPAPTKAPPKATAAPAATKAAAKTPRPTRTPKASATLRPSASARTTTGPAGGGTTSGRGSGVGESPTSGPLAEKDVLMLGILLLTFGSISGVALFVFGRRQAPRSPRLAAAGAVVAEPVSPPTRHDDWAPEPANDEEAGLPRWLRPSVREGRFWTPERASPSRHLLARRAAAFTAAPTDGVRMAVRYDDTTLFDSPNESYAAIVGRLHTGDEVFVTRTDADWAQVHTPMGATGWVPSMTLAGMQAEPPPVTPPEAPAATAQRKPKRSRSRAAPKPRSAPS